MKNKWNQGCGSVLCLSEVMASSAGLSLEASRADEMSSLSSLLRTFLPDQNDFPQTDNAQELLRHVENSDFLKSPTEFSSFSSNESVSEQPDILNLANADSQASVFSDKKCGDEDDDGDSDATIDFDISDFDNCSAPQTCSTKASEKKVILGIGKYYACFLCDNGFISLSTYKDHMNTHCRDDSQHRCFDCGNGFASKSTFSLHERLAPYELWLEKNIQKKVSKSSNLDGPAENQEMSADESEVHYTCNICGFASKKYRKFKDHVFRHGASKAFRCALCPNAFDAPCMLRFHIDTQHSQILPFQCMRCFRRFKLKCSLSTHLKFCKIDRANLKYAEELQFIDHLNQQRKFQGIGEDEKGLSQFSCPVCMYMFDSPEELHTHLLKHDETRPFQCHTCGQGFGNKITLQKHMQLHEAIKEWKCDICGVELVSRSGYRAHLRGHKNLENLQAQAAEAIGKSTVFGGLDSDSVVKAMEQSGEGVEIKKEVLSDDESVEHSVRQLPKKKVIPTYQCPMCDLKFFTGGEKFQTHVRKEHPDAPLENCDKCHKKIYGKDNLVKHRDIHRLYSQTFPCEVCGRMFRRKYALEVHKKIHSFKKFVKCDICGQEFRFVSEVEKHKHAQHKYDRTLSIYKCNICGQKFPVLSHLSVHCYCHNMPDAKAFECDLCKTSFKTPTELKQHIYLNHDHLMKTNGDNEKILIPKSGMTIPGFEGVVFKQEHSDEGDLNLASGKKGDAKSPSSSSSNLSPQTTNGSQNKEENSDIFNSQTPQNCVDAYNFATRQSMLHSRFLKRFSCEVCLKTFSTKSDLKTHLRTHSGETPFPCNFCNRSFKQRGHRKLHIQVTHTKEMPYKCAQCGAAFPTRYRYQVHIKRHVGFKEFKCLYCSKEFYTKGKMNEHKKLRHRKEWEKEQIGVISI